MKEKESFEFLLRVYADGTATPQQRRTVRAYVLNDPSLLDQVVEALRRQAMKELNISESDDVLHHAPAASVVSESASPELGQSAFCSATTTSNIFGSKTTPLSELFSSLLFQQN